MRKIWTVAMLALCAAALLLCAGCAKPAEVSYSTAKSQQAGLPNYAINVKEYLQMPTLAGGCEVASLICVLESMGYEVDEYDLVEDHLDLNKGSSFASTYTGSPFVQGAGYPPVLARCANSFFVQQGSSTRAMSHKGCSFDMLMEEVEKGVPVMVWTTMQMEPAYHTNSVSDGYEWYANEHCVVMYGVDDEGLLISDPLDGLVVRDAEKFQSIFEDCGSMAVTFYNTKQVSRG